MRLHGGRGQEQQCPLMRSTRTLRRYGDQNPSSPSSPCLLSGGWPAGRLLCCLLRSFYALNLEGGHGKQGMRGEKKATRERHQSTCSRFGGKREKRELWMRLNTHKKSCQIPTFQNSLANFINQEEVSSSVSFTKLNQWRRLVLLYFNCLVLVFASLNFLDTHTCAQKRTHKSTQAKLRLDLKTKQQQLWHISPSNCMHVIACAPPSSSFTNPHTHPSSSFSSPFFSLVLIFLIPSRAHEQNYTLTETHFPSTRILPRKMCTHTDTPVRLPGTLRGLAAEGLTTTPPTPKTCKWTNSVNAGTDAHRSTPRHPIPPVININFSVPFDFLYISVSKFLLCVKQKHFRVWVGI